MDRNRVSRATSLARLAALALSLALVSAASPQGFSPESAASAASWKRLTIPPREGLSLVYDSRRHQVIAFGGFDGAHYLDDVWVRDASPDGHWAALDVAPGPRPRAGHGAAYDSTGDRMIVFCGHDDQYRFIDVWALSLGGTPTWVYLGYSVNGPYNGFAAICDPVGQHIVAFGGNTDNRVWTMPLAGPWTWTQAAIPAGPVGRSGHTATYDPVRRRMLVFGGYGNVGGYFNFLNDTWALSLDTMTWQEIAAADPPPARTEHVAGYDPVADRLLILGGRGAGPFDEHYEWGLDLSGSPQWHYLYVTDYCPPMQLRVRAAACDDLPGSRWFIAGGATDLGGPVADAWYENHAAPLPLFEPLALEPLELTAAFYDPPRQRMVLQGGLDPDLSSRATWSVTGQSFAQIEALPSNGPHLGGHSIVYDSSRDRAIALAGVFSGGLCYPFVTSEAWSLSLDGSPAWTELSPAGTAPAARRDAAAVYDPIGDRVVLFGGSGDGNAPTSLMTDTWALELAGGPQWVELHPAGTPPDPRLGHRAVYDPTAHRMLVYGGEGAGGVAFGDVWALDLNGDGAWSLLGPAGSPPAARWDHSLVLDTRRRRLLVYGGRTAGGTASDLWSLALSPALEWSPLAPVDGPPEARAGHAAVYDSTLDRMLVFGGRDPEDLLLGDVWALDLGAVVGAPGDVAGRPPALTLSAAMPNPTRGGARFVLELPGAAPVEAAIYDLAGRRVRGIAMEGLAPGRHQLRWDGATSDGKPAETGVYFLGVRVGGARLVRRVLIVK